MILAVAANVKLTRSAAMPHNGADHTLDSDNSGGVDKDFGSSEDTGDTAIPSFRKHESDGVKCDMPNDCVNFCMGKKPPCFVTACGSSGAVAKVCSCNMCKNG